MDGHVWPFFLAQHRDVRFIDPMVRLFESGDLDLKYEWLFLGRLFYFEHRHRLL